MFFIQNLYSSAIYGVDFSTHTFIEGLKYEDGNLKIINEFKEIYTSTYPSKRRKFAFVEISDSKLLLFGGTIDTTTLDASNQTWIFDLENNSWQILNLSSAPIKRAGISAVFDEITNKVLIFGGVGETYFDDTWIFDVGNFEWQRIVTSTHPSKRHGYGIAISSPSKAVLFGGITEGGVYLNDTWEFDFINNSWRFLNVSTSPPVRAYMGMAGDGEGRILMFGGEDSSGYRNDTWIFENNNWTEISPSISPSNRTGAGLIFNKKAGVFILFGGYKKDIFGEGAVNEIWFFTPEDFEWHNMSGKFKVLPSKRFYFGFTYSNKEEKSFIFGGDGGSDYLNDTWIHIVFSQGVFISSIKDTGISSFPVDYFNIYFNGSFPSSCDVKFQISTSSDGILFSDFRGPDGNTTSFYTVNGESIYEGEDGGRFLKLKILMKYNIFTSEDFLLYFSSISYNHRPEAPILYAKYFGKGETTSELTPNFTWYNSNDPDGEIHYYTLEVSTEINFINPVVVTGIEEDKSLGYSYSWTTPTLSEGYYFFRVKCFDDLTESPYSEVWNFYVDTTPPAQVFDLTAITGDRPGEIKLYWTNTGDDGYSGDINDGFIHIKYREKEDFLNWFVSGLNEVKISTSVRSGEYSFYILTGLKNNTSYYIAIALEDEAVEKNSNLGVGSGGSVKRVFAWTDRYPVIEFKKPEGGILNGIVEVSWNKFDPDGDDVKVDLYFEAGGVENFIKGNLDTTYYFLNTYPFKDGNVRFKIVAKDSRNLSKDFYSSYFILDNPNFSPSIEILNPADNSVIEGEISINWVYSDTNSWQNHSFEIFCSTDNIDYKLIASLDKNTTFYIWNTYLLPNGTYFLKVKITDEEGLSDEDYVDNIILNNPNLAPESFNLISPSKGEYVYTLTPEFKWEEAVDPDGDPVSYTLFISSLNDFSTYYEVKNISSTSYRIVFDLENYSSYYWRVKASDSRGLSRWANQMDFYFNINIGSFTVESIFPEEESSVLYSVINEIDILFNKPPFNLYKGHIEIYEDGKVRDDFNISASERKLYIYLSFLPSRKYEVFLSSSIVDFEGNNLSGKRNFVFYTLMSKDEDNFIIFEDGEFKIFLPNGSLSENARVSFEKLYFDENEEMRIIKENIEKTNAGRFLYPYYYKIEILNGEGEKIENLNKNVELYFRIKDEDGNGFWDNTYYPVKQVEVKRFSSNNWITIDSQKENGYIKSFVSGLSLFSIFAKAKYYKSSSIIEGINIFPNPFKDEIYIWYKINGNYDLNIKIYSLVGDIVKKERIPAGTSPPYIWDGKNFKNEEVEDGTYILIMEAGGERIKKIIGKIK